jgi:hypothetical protein
MGSSGTEDRAGSAADVNAFLAEFPRRTSSMGLKLYRSYSFKLDEHSVLPQSPWNVPSGYYTRSDGSGVYIPADNKPLKPQVQADGNESTECVVERNTVA